MRDQQGFTLVELMIAMAITGLIVSAIAGALVVSFQTTGVTQQRLAESHDVQITSAYLANDIQSAASLNASSGGSCSGASTELVRFTYADKHGNTIGDAVYSCGTSGGETQVTRTFSGDTVVLAHFAGTARPTVTCAPSCGGTSATGMAVRLGSIEHAAEVPGSGQPPWIHSGLDVPVESTVTSGGGDPVPVPPLLYPRREPTSV